MNIFTDWQHQQYIPWLEASILDLPSWKIMNSFYGSNWVIQIEMFILKISWFLGEFSHCNAPNGFPKMQIASILVEGKGWVTPILARWLYIQQFDRWLNKRAKSCKRCKAMITTMRLVLGKILYKCE